MSIDLTKLYATQISLTEWFENMKHQDSAALRIEDNEKRERLKVLNKIIGLPFDKPYQFSAQDVADRTPGFEKFLEEHGYELCALRLIPTDPNLPKLRTRGYSVRDVLKWFVEQQVDPSKYRADFVPHPSDHIWSTIFIVNKNGVHGEIIKGSHNQLTQGFYDEGEPITFTYDNFTRWQLTPANPAAEEYLKKIIPLLCVSNKDAQAQLIKDAQATFAHNYLCGYFETVASSEFGTWFIDYNRILGNIYQNFMVPVSSVSETKGNIITGQIGSRGKVVGKVKIINAENISNGIEEGCILVCEMTTPNYLPLMQKSKAVVTDLGGILSHAAIVAREMKIPCIIGTKVATKTLQDGDVIEVDADNGIVRIIQE